MRMPTTIATLLLAGCAAPSVPNVLTEQGTKTTHWTDRTPAVAATCITGNAERAAHDLFGVSVRRGRADRVEVSISFKSTGAEYALVQIDPVVGGSAITIWRTSYTPTEPDGGWPGQFMDGC